MNVLARQYPVVIILQSTGETCGWEGWGRRGGRRMLMKHTRPWNYSVAHPSPSSIVCEIVVRDTFDHFRDRASDYAAHRRVGILLHPSVIGFDRQRRPIRGRETATEVPRPAACVTASVRVERYYLRRSFTLSIRGLFEHRYSVGGLYACALSVDDR